MKTLLTLLVLLTSSPLYATWRESTVKLLPPELQTFKSGVTTLKDIEAKLGKAALVKGSKHYWVYEKFEYALEVDFKNEKMDGMHFTFPHERPSLKTIAKFIPIKKFLPASEAPTRLLRYKDKEGALTIDMASQTIYSVRLP
ncbi:MAG: hypothetical protein K2P81_09795 [Bacteriovoracaceae bacterium]|nr:hypothetical protein [Bacteriovoracaceae bacterium]